MKLKANMFFESCFLKQITSQENYKVVLLHCDLRNTKDTKTINQIQKSKMKHSKNMPLTV